MNIADIFKDTHKQVRLEELIPMDEYWYDKFNGDSMSFEEWSEMAEDYGYELDKFHVHPSGTIMNTFFYVGEYGTVKFPTIKMDWLSESLNIGMQDHDDYMKSLFESGEYDVYFFPEINSMPIGYFIKHYNKIKKEERFDTFSSLYSFLEYGFKVFPDELIQDVLSLAPKGEAVEKVLENHTLKKGKLSVYRGMTSESTPLNESMSWTLDLKVAKFFANRFESKGKVYRARVSPENIINYLQDRNEEEVWVRYDDLENVKSVKF
jgi:hypothetical protein